VHFAYRSMPSLTPGAHRSDRHEANGSLQHSMKRSLRSSPRQLPAQSPVQAPRPLPARSSPTRQQAHVLPTKAVIVATPSTTAAETPPKVAAVVRGRAPQEVGARACRPRCCWDATMAEVPSPTERREAPVVRISSPSSASNAGTPMPQSAKSGRSNRSLESDRAAEKPWFRGRLSPCAYSPSPERLTRTDTGVSTCSPGSCSTRLAITERAREDLQELMRSKDKLRQYAERPFKKRGLPPGSQLGFEEFKEAMTEILQELEMSIPVDQQMRALFDKFSRGTEGAEGLGCEEFEALLFRFLCFLRGSEEVQLQKTRDRAISGTEERDKKWREEFIQKNLRKFHDVYEIQKELGKGSFGTVHLVRHKTQRDSKNEQRERVCKIISKAKARAAKTPESKVREEFAVLKQLDHPHVLRIFEDFEDEHNFYLLMEPCRGGDLAQYVKALEPMDATTYEHWVAKVMQQTLSAVAYCHAKAVIHKDLKPENVMLSTPRETSVHAMHVVVVDFGLAEMFAHPTDRSDVVSGTPPYMAPEVWQGNFSKSCDVWSVGCMLFFLLSGRLPFVANSLKEFPKAVMTEPDWTLMGGATQEAQNICRHMLSKMEHQRPTAQMALKDKWFVNMKLATGDDVKALDRGHIDSLLAVGERSDFEKFVTRFVATQIDASQERSANAIFRSFDTNGDGLLSPEELRLGLSSFGASAEAVDQVVTELDIGGTGQVSYTEFLAGVIDLRAKKPAEQEKLLGIAWDQFGPDEQGRVKASSIQDALAARGATVADLPKAFFTLLNKDASGYLTFAEFKELLLSDSSGQVVRSLSQEKHRGGKLLRFAMRWWV